MPSIKAHKGTLKLAPQAFLALSSHKYYTNPLNATAGVEFSKAPQLGGVGGQGDDAKRVRKEIRRGTR